MSINKPSINFIDLEKIPIFQQLQWEEALLRVNTSNWCIFNRGSPPAIVMGISGKKEQLIHKDKLQLAPLPLIRRFSGGGTVVVDEDTLFVTLICQSTTLPISPFPRSLMNWTAELYRPLFPSYPFQLSENDYSIGDRKWGGNAQSIIKGRWLHHSSLLWNYNSDYMDYLLIPPKAPAYRQGRDHCDFLCCLKDYWHSCSHFQEQFMQQLSNHFILIKKDVSEIEQIARLPHRKMTCLID